MVQQSPTDVRVPTDVRDEKSFLPRRAQPWETASIVFGIPGAILSALATCALVMYAPHGDAFLAGTAATLIVTGYLGTMGVLWVGVASEQAAS